MAEVLEKLVIVICSGMDDKPMAAKHHSFKNFCHRSPREHCRTQQTTVEWRSSIHGTCHRRNEPNYQFGRTLYCEKQLFVTTARLQIYATIVPRVAERTSNNNIEQL